MDSNNNGKSFVPVAGPCDQDKVQKDPSGQQKVQSLGAVPPPLSLAILYGGGHGSAVDKERSLLEWYDSGEFRSEEQGAHFENAVFSKKWTKN